VLPEITQYHPSRAETGVKLQTPKGVILADPTFDSGESWDQKMDTLQKSHLGWVVVGEPIPRASPC